jgi:hypothetical protein
MKDLISFVIAVLALIWVFENKLNIALLHDHLHTIEESLKEEEK